MDDKNLPEATEEYRQNGSASLDNTEFHDMIRGGRTEPEIEDIGSEREEPSRDEVRETRSQERPESEIVTEREPEQRRVDPRDARVQELENEIRQLRGAVLGRLSEPDRSTRQAEPEIELVDLAPGIRLPKNKDQWPVKLTPEVMKSIGLDPEVAEPMNILGNALLYHLANGLTAQFEDRLQTFASQRERASASRNAFYRAFPDLQGKEDLLNSVERNLRERGLANARLSDAEYGARVGMAVRHRIAELRGQDMQTYMRDVERTFGGNNTQNRNVPAVTERAGSRARFGPGTGRRAGTHRERPNNQDAEMREMM